MASDLATQVRGFYAVLDRDDVELARALVEPSGGGARVLQLRMKRAGTAEIVRVAHVTRRIAAEAGALFIVNDRVDVALAVGADGVHLGQEDLPLADARRVAAAAQSRLVIGISTHNLAQVEGAVTGGADYLGFGPVYATTTKEAPEPVVGLRGLAAAVERAGAVPVVAIGGITPARVGEVARAGAAAACAITAVTGAHSPAEVARRLGQPWRSDGSID